MSVTIILYLKKNLYLCTAKTEKALGILVFGKVLKPYGTIIIKVWQDAKNDTATNKNKTPKMQDWHLLLQTKLKEQQRNSLEGRVDEKVRESISRVKPRMEVPEMNGMVVARCLCEMLDMKLDEQTYQQFFCDSQALDEAVATFVDFRRLVKSDILVDRFAA